jgi:hypothetical protein
MNKLIDYLIEFLQDLKKMDKAKLNKELRELAYYINRQFFNQIPSVSAIAGLVVGSWVVSTFTTSPLRGFLASWGLMKGGTHVVSSTTYRVLSVVFPILATAVTAYIVQKALKTFREKRLQKDMARAAQLGKEVQSELRGKMDILNKAKEAGLVSESEYHTKKATLYQAYLRQYTSKVEEFLINKISG